MTSNIKTSSGLNQCTVVLKRTVINPKHLLTGCTDKVMPVFRAIQLEIGFAIPADISFCNQMFRYECLDTSVNRR